VQVINTHLGLRRHERLAQVNALLGPDWLGHPSCREPVIVTGDFNAVPGSRAYRRMAERLCDAQLAPHIRRPRATFPVGLPFLRIDHVFVSRSIEVTRVETLRTPLTRRASDHLPLLVDFRVLAPSERRHSAHKPARTAKASGLVAHRSPFDPSPEIPAW
jgi:endonuclease/exonuclease/phosphatase family metal-dependent hydrolase